MRRDYRVYIDDILEATKCLHGEITEKYPEVPWRAMAGMRDKPIHEYFGVNLEVLWKTMKDDLLPPKPLI